METPQETNQTFDRFRSFRRKGTFRSWKRLDGAARY
jgi:hypothetical protein